MKKLNVEKVSISSLDIEELACKILGIDYEEIDADESIIEEALHDEFFIDLDTFRDIVSRLLPLIDVGTSELTNTKFKGFSDIENKMWLVKTEVDN